MSATETLIQCQLSTLFQYCLKTHIAIPTVGTVYYLQTCFVILYNLSRLYKHGRKSWGGRGDAEGDMSPPQIHLIAVSKSKDKDQPS